MSQENVEIVRGAFAAFERGDISHMIDLMADGAVFECIPLRAGQREAVWVPPRRSRRGSS